MRILFGLLLFGGALGWGEKERVRLEDVQVLTLTRGAMTTGRRSSPVPQLACVGGSGRGEEQPERVQCYNRGSDGRGVQWECKADMDNGLRFGQVEVVCEGYDYPDDPYILAGSCGLEYTLELTKEGREKRSSGGGGWGGGWSNPSNSYSSKSYSDSSHQWSGLGDLILLGVIGIVIYAVYKTCVDSPSMEDRQNGAGSASGGGGGMGGGGWTNPGAGGHGGNTGAGLGGMLFYMFGNRGGGGYGGYYKAKKTQDLLKMKGKEADKVQDQEDHAGKYYTMLGRLNWLNVAVLLLVAMAISIAISTPTLPILGEWACSETDVVRHCQQELKLGLPEPGPPEPPEPGPHKCKVFAKVPGHDPPCCYNDQGDHFGLDDDVCFAEHNIDRLTYPCRVGPRYPEVKMVDNNCEFTLKDVDEQDAGCYQFYMPHNSKQPLYHKCVELDDICPYSVKYSCKVRMWQIQLVCVWFSVLAMCLLVQCA